MQDNVFGTRSACFVIFALGIPFSWRLSTKCTSLYKTAFSAQDENVLLFLHLAHHLLAFSAKLTSLYKTAFSARDQHVLSFLHWAHHFLAIFSKVKQFVQNSVVRTEQDQHVLSFSHWAHHFLACSAKCTSLYETDHLSPRSERCLIFSLGAILFSHFKQGGRVCAKQRFQPMMSTFCHFRTGRTTF